MILAVEDVLSELVVKKILSVVRPDLTVAVTLKKSGKGYLQERARDLNRTAASQKVFILADLDNPNICPADLIAEWLHGPQERHLLFRLAIMEIESWILGDHEGIAAFLSIPKNKIPANTDGILQPKEQLIALARNSRSRKIKEDLLPRQGGTASVGPGYNSTVGTFVSDAWNPIRAANRSVSLNRTINRLVGF